jgi:hypothetical protein
MWNRIAELWCKKMHNQAMWPMHGKYICPVCLREYPVAWEASPRGAEYADPGLRPQHVPVPTAVSLYQ